MHLMHHQTKDGFFAGFWFQHDLISVSHLRSFLLWKSSFIFIINEVYNIYHVEIDICCQNLRLTQSKRDIWCRNLTFMRSEKTTSSGKILKIDIAL